MANIILFTTRPITSKYTKSLIEQMCIMKEYTDKGHDIILFTCKRKEENLRYIEEVAGIKISKMISYIDDYDRCMRDPKPIYDSWYEFIEKEDWITQLDDVAEIVVFGALQSDAGKLTREWAGLNRMMTTRNQMNFVANGTYMSGLFQLVKLSRERKVPIHEICYDPTEHSLSLLTDYLPHELHCYHGYDWPDYDLERLDSLQEYLNKEEGFWSFFQDKEKSVDLCFGFTALTAHREEQYDQLMASLDANEVNAKLFIRHKRLGIDTFVKRDEYLDNIRKARYTLIIPPYDLKHFSVYRFLESIHNECLPLITKDVHIEDFVKSFELSPEYINKITVDYLTIGNKINELSESERLEILEYFKGKCLQTERKLKIGL